VIDPSEPSKATIPYSLQASIFTINVGEAPPIGGLFSSINDMTKIGRSILGSDILDQNTTRAWLKPASFISDLRGAVGRPWEIYRIDASTSERGVIDTYGKGGDAGPCKQNHRREAKNRLLM